MDGDGAKKNMSNSSRNLMTLLELFFLFLHACGIIIFLKNKA
jgi:hypothetical protein